MIVKTSAPGKLLLLGDHAVLYQRPCLVAAINRYIRVTTSRQPIGEESVFVSSTRKLFEDKYGTISESLVIDGFDSRYGLGSSAAVTVAVARALFKLKKIKVSKRELFSFCYQVVIKVQGVGSGFDLAAAIWQGVIYFVTGGKQIKPLAVTSLPLIVGYSGVKADTTTMIRKVASQIKPEFLNQSAQIVNQGRKEMEKQNWTKLGKLMTENQKLLKLVGASTDKLEKLITAALGAGAYGAKLSGAGGGDCMIALVAESKREQVAAAIRQASGEVIGVKLAL
jgi:mevalonate kinase